MCQFNRIYLKIMVRLNGFIHFIRIPPVIRMYTVNIVWWVQCRRSWLIVFIWAMKKWSGCMKRRRWWHTVRILTWICPAALHLYENYWIMVFPLHWDQTFQEAMTSVWLRFWPKPWVCQRWSGPRWMPAMHCLHYRKLSIWRLREADNSLVT